MRPLPQLTLRLLIALVPFSLGAQLVDRPVFIDTRVPKPPAIASARAGDVLLYELHVTSFEQKPLTWTAIDVLDAVTGVTLLTVRDSALARGLARPGQGAVPPGQPTTLGGGLRAVLYLQVPVSASARPSAIRHRLTFTDSAGTRSVVTAATPVMGRVAVIGPPLRGGAWFAANGPSNTSGHRRALLALNGQTGIAQRFAIDYVLFDSTFNTHRGDSLDNTRYYAHNVEVLAVADGIVVAVKDGLPENVPGENSRAVPITLETVGGNHIILDIGDGRFAFYAHLRPGTIGVKVGEGVKRGAVLARLGNTGNSTEPHLHFHLADANSPLGAEGIPYVHERFDFVGACQAFGSGCAWSTPDTRRLVMPFENDIVRFR